MSAPFFPSAVDATAIRDFRSCPQKFFRAHIQRIVPSAVRSPDLVAGAAFASGVEIVRRLVYGNQQLPLGEALPYAFRVMAGEFGYEDPDTQELYDAPDGHPKTFLNTVSALLYYFTVWPPLSDSVQPYYRADGEPAVEFNFSIPLPVNHPVTGDPLLYQGRFDMLGKLTEMLTVVDEKTTKSLGASWAKQWDLRSQFLGYIWAARQHDYPATCALIRGVSILKTKHDHLQVILQPGDWLIERWYTQTIRTVKDMVRHFEEGFWDWDLDDSCNDYGGCAYKPLCSTKNPEAWLGDYKERVWNPLAKNPAMEAAVSLQKQSAQ